ncbi:Lrp/AsnC family transcriptional regulator [Aliishimia ponticola]|uniref:Lrp/AsnC family transcriptional regulator n=1 Tax=Aliishimia ponticola TaxID=2499833 RepID=A0A4S4NEP3_9RHOB|nr:Lrp/AsnC family transcriptional regulator [Aliishimia ponticola]THH37027.1 Lrp/AsnC family transcriptional regulator [Aliishimia ponticola]
MSDKSSLDGLDARMLAVLQKDASLSVADLAERVASSPATCWRRLRALEADGVIGPPRRLVDPAAVGRGMDAFVQVRMKSQDAASRASFARAMEAESTIVEVYAISGDWDYLLHLLVRDIADLDDILMRRVLEQDCVAGTSTIFALRRVKHTAVVPV